jgi:Ku70/Ku80 beta-barrel domain
LQRYYGNWLSSAAISVSASVLIHAITDSASKYFCYASDLERQHQLRVSKHSHCPLPPTRKEELRFRLLRGKDLSPVNYKRVAEKDGKEVPWDEIVKGYEYEKGKYVVLKDEDFQRVDLEATQTVDI